MPDNWLEIRVRLLHGRGTALDPPPGRVLVVGPRHAGSGERSTTRDSFRGWQSFP